MRILLQKSTWLRFMIAAMVSCGLFIGLYHIMTVEGADNNPRFMMIRLEDIGPGGYYGSLEGLGKLRAVLDYLNQQHVHYSMAVVPRWINIMADGTRYDRSIDQLDNRYIQSFDTVLREAIEHNGTIGMHGYTHQAGDVRREDGHHASGVGNEFNVSDMPETATVAFAENRVKEGLKRFRKAGITPHFWEAPHYHTTPEQDKVFRSYFGLFYQPDVTLNPNPPAAQYENVLNKGYGNPSLGNVFVPTTLSYIPYGKDEKFILNQMGKTERINSFFYHPFLEFSHLEPIVDELGEPVMKDGIPAYQYAEENKSVLQRLVTQIHLKGYPFYSINDYVPFTPAGRLKIGSTKSTLVQIGSVTGRSQMDIVSWDKKTANMSVMQGQYQALRNDSQPAQQVWASVPYTDGSAFTLNSRNDRTKKGLWVVRPTGKLESYTSSGSAFARDQIWTIPANRWYDLYELRQTNGDCVLAGQSQDRSQLLGVYLHGSEAKAIKPYTFRSNSSRDLIVRNLRNKDQQSLFLFKENTSQGVEFELDKVTLQWKLNKVTLNIPDELGSIRFGDFNGDGKEDILRWDSKNLTNRVYQQTTENEYRMLSVFGPWGRANVQLAVADFDGNGKDDIAIYPSDDAHLDVALSFQSQNVNE
ncbi:hypothetical protein SAMN04487897_104223 [Paenibacillus sp. yr247]|uniref:DUF2334 domain-containing protein n=1 Tax=Paenibacillus sp. yr247 TaxID=1761880 RepID=UPI000889073C|nr:DUF2334 domain-containing protein [Paenibacillus sp. yr247]SDN72991.1 hypothetical protein SAMN04487897_104223 [Paenibacillus sp. yr247]